MTTKQASAKRETLGKAAMDRRSQALQTIRDEVMALQPLGRVSDLSLVMGYGGKGVVRAVASLGTLAFAKTRLPTEVQLRRWAELHAQAEAELTTWNFYTGSSANGAHTPNTVIGNFRVVEHLRRLNAEGLLSTQERRTLAVLENFWAEHPSEETGCWGDGYKIIPWSEVERRWAEEAVA